MLHVEIYTPEKTVFKGEAQSVQMPGNDGLFEVLSGHAPLISSLSKGNVRIKDDAENNSHYGIDGGFVEVLNDHVSILVEGVKG